MAKNLSLLEGYVPVTVAGPQGLVVTLRMAEQGAEGKVRTALGLHRVVALIQQGRATGLHLTGLMHPKIWCRLKVGLLVCS